MDKLDEISRRRKEAHTKLQSLKSKVYEAFLHMEEAAFSDGVLPKKTKELIAVGISVKIDCESCMQWHIEQAAAAGGRCARSSRRSRWRSRWAAGRRPSRHASPSR